MHSIRKSVCVVVTKNLNRTVTVNSAISEENAQSKPWTSIPGPKSLPIVGQLHHFLPGGMFADPIKMVEVLYEKYGPIVRFDGRFGSPTLIFLLDAEASAQILRNENWMPARPGFASFEHYRKRYNKNKPDEPTGLLTEHGEAWRKFRTTVNPILLHTKTIKLYSKVLEEVAEDMVARMRHLRKQDNTIDGKLDTEMNLWALESIGVVALGGRLNCLDPNLPEDSPARRLIQTVHGIFKMADKLDLKPSLWRYIGTPNYYKAMKYYEDQTNLSRYFINQAREQFKTKDQSNYEKGILEKLLEIDENVAYIMAGDMLLGGVDTASNTMLATFYLLATNPEKQDKLRQEILSRSEQKPYLKACIKESLRVKPVVAGNLRATSKEYDILGYRIPKDMLVTFGHQFLSMSEDHFPRAKEYIPERWLVDKTDPLHYRNAHPFAYNPFGFGARSCIGRRIAELEIETFLSKTIENFQIEWTGGELNVRPASLNYIVEPFNFIFKDV